MIDVPQYSHVDVIVSTVVPAADRPKVTEFLYGYRRLCGSIEGAFMRNEYSEARDLMTDFWQALLPQHYQLLEDDFLIDMISFDDCVLYETLIKILFPGGEESATESALIARRLVAEDWTHWVVVSMGEVPYPSMTRKTNASQRFTRAVELQCAYLQQERPARNILMDENKIECMLRDVHEFNPDTVVKLSTSTMSHDELLKQLQRLLIDRSPMQDYVSWLKTVVETYAIVSRVNREEIKISDAEYFSDRWPSFGQTIVNQLILKSAPSLDSFKALFKFFDALVSLTVKTRTNYEKYKELRKKLSRLVRNYGSEPSDSRNHTEKWQNWLSESRKVRQTASSQPSDAFIPGPSFVDEDLATDSASSFTREVESSGAYSNEAQPTSSRNYQDQAEVWKGWKGGAAGAQGPLTAEIPATLENKHFKIMRRVPNPIYNIDKKYASPPTEIIQTSSFVDGGCGELATGSASSFGREVESSGEYGSDTQPSRATSSSIYQDEAEAWKDVNDLADAELQSADIVGFPENMGMLRPMPHNRPPTETVQTPSLVDCGFGELATGSASSFGREVEYSGAYGSDTHATSSGIYQDQTEAWKDLYDLADAELQSLIPIENKMDEDWKERTGTMETSSYVEGGLEALVTGGDNSKASENELPSDVEELLSDFMPADEEIDFQTTSAWPDDLPL